MKRLEMKNCNIKLIEKLQNMGEENKYLMGEEILPSVPSQIIQQSKFTYSLLGKVFK